jgi:Protein of unknown function (DUF3102)
VLLAGVRVMSAALTTLAERINDFHDAAFRSARDAIDAAVECGRLLLEAKAHVGHGEWLAWLEDNTTVSVRQSQKYMRLAKYDPGSHLSINDALAALAEPKTAIAHTLRVMGSSESAEWYTPPHIVERVVETLGEVDLDPSWHPESPVQARATFTATDAGTVSEAIALVPARVDTAWFRRLDRFPRCFVWGRLTFANAENPAPFPSAVVYLGNNVECFVEAFGQVGSIFVRFGEAAL